MRLFGNEIPNTLKMHDVPLLSLHWIAACCFATIAAAAPTTANSADTATTQRWAIVALDDESQPAGELLTVQLGNRAGVELVERSAIQAVLAEQQLAASGLAAPEHSLRLGALLSADALILINQPAEITPRQLRVRLIEVATGALVLDTFAPAADVERGAAAAVKELDHARRTLAIPATERRYVSVAGVRSEESGELLDSPGRLLRAFLEADLGRIKSVVVLEREQVHRLVTEAHLTGAEQQLRASTWLLEAGLRRDPDGDGYVVSCNLHPLGNHAGKSFQVAIPGDLLVARGKLAAAIAKQLDVSNVGVSVSDRTEEADLFARKRDWYASVTRPHDAQEMAEAAAALAPTKDNMMRLFKLYYSEARAKSGSLEIHDALLAATRYNEARLAWLQRAAGDGDLFPHVLRQCRFAFQPAIRHRWVEPKEDAKLRSELNQLTMQLFDLVWRDLKDDCESKRRVWNDAMLNAFRVANSWDEYLAILEKLQALFIEELGGSREEFEASLLHYYQLRAEQSSSKWVAADAVHRGKFEARMRAAARVAANDENIIRRLQALKLRMEVEGDEGAEAARAIVQTLLPRPPDVPAFGTSQHIHYNLLMFSTYRRLGQVGEADALYERILRTAEENHDAELLVFWSSTVNLGFGNFSDQKKREIAPRILAVLKDADINDPAYVNVLGLRQSITNTMIRQGLMAPPVFTTESGPGAWKGFVAHPIPIRRLPGSFELHEVLFDKRPAAAAHDEQLVLIWKTHLGLLSVERLSLRGGTPRKIGPEIPGIRVPFHGIQVVIGDDDTVYVASEPAGFVVVGDAGAQTIGPSEGAPGERVQALAWLDGRLYIAFKNAFSVFDPASKRFELLGSAAAVQPHSPLDGGAGYDIFEMLADSDNHCLWFQVQADTADNSRDGIWRYEPTNNKFTHVSNRVSKAHLSESVILASYWNDDTWSEVDRKTCTIKPLSGYAPRNASPSGYSGERTMLRFGRNIIDVYGRIFTPEGLVHEMTIEQPWPFLQHAESGFLTHFDYRKSQLWMVTPREHNAPAEPNSASD